MGRDPITVLVVTPVRLYADGIARALNDADEIRRVAIEESCSAALRRLRREPPDVAILDLAGIDRPDEAEAFARAAHPANVVAFAVRPSDREVIRWAEHGVKGILTLEASLEELLHAVVAAADGECRCSPCVITALMRQIAAAAKRESAGMQVVLTRRERQVAELLAEGHSNKEIAAELMLGQSTVKNHVHHLLGKAQARTRAEAAARLVAAGILISEPPGSGSPAKPRRLTIRILKGPFGRLRARARRAQDRGACRCASWPSTSRPSFATCSTRR